MHGVILTPDFSYNRVKNCNYRLVTLPQRVKTPDVDNYLSRKFIDKYHLHQYNDFNQSSLHGKWVLLVLSTSFISVLKVFAWWNRSRDLVARVRRPTLRQIEHKCILL
jgi:hypothetical protein